MPFNKSKQIYICFHLNSGAGPEKNRKLMLDLANFYSKNREDFPTNHKLWIPHNAIPPKWSEPKAMKRCIREVTHSNKFYLYRMIDPITGKFYEMSFNMRIEFNVAKICKIPIINKTIQPEKTSKQQITFNTDSWPTSKF